MRFGSLFSGIGGLDLGLERAGMTPAWQVEIDTHCQRVLTEHWPDVRRYSDVRAVHATGIYDECGQHCVGCLAPVDLVCGGFPCQDLSVAGKRAGLAGERSGLWHEFRRVIAEIAPRWVLIENVPGLLSSNSGEDFAVVIEGLVGLGYGVAWRVLDAQYFGVPQRRRRVFVVGCLGDWAAPAAVLLEPESVSGDSPPRRTARQGAPAGPLGGITGGQREDLDGMTYLPMTVGTVSGGAHPGGHDDQVDGNVLVSVAVNQRREGRVKAVAGSVSSHTSNTQFDGVLETASVRRLTPTECERLQGFPDGWTDGQSDSARYRQLGNAVAVPVAEWIAHRIATVAASLREAA